MRTGPAPPASRSTGSSSSLGTPAVVEPDQAPRGPPPSGAPSRACPHPRSSPLARLTPGRCGRSRGCARSARAPWPPASSSSRCPRPRIVCRSGSAVLSEQREQAAELLVARGQPVSHLPGRGDVDRHLLWRLAADQLHGALDGEVDRGRRRAEVAGDERLQLVDDRLVALGGGTCTSACEPRIWPIGEAGGGDPTSARIRASSSSTSSMRSPAAFALRWTSSAATSPGGKRCCAASVATRGGVASPARHR